MIRCYKTILSCAILIFCFQNFSKAQNQKNFGYTEYLVYDKGTGRYLTNGSDTSVYLQGRVETGKEPKFVQYSVNSNNGVTYYYDSVPKYDTKIVTKDLFNKKLTTNKLKGDFTLEEDEIRFYPWTFTQNASYDANYKGLNEQVAEYDYFISMPTREVISVRFYSFQYGALTLPVKVYLKSASDTLINNIETDINLNVMLGFKWGTKNYLRLPSEKEGSSYESAFSLNMIFGVSKVDLSDANTTPTATISSEFSTGFFSTGLSFGYQYRDIGTYLVFGTDFPLSKYGRDWDYATQPWIGIGLGLGL